MNDPIKYLLLTCSITIIILPRTSYARVERETQPRVTILQGTLQGKTLTTINERPVSAFLGIPYGQPPIGNLRFVNPVAAERWFGTRDAIVDTNVCPQISGTEIIGDEDCLNLNVYTPQRPKKTSSSLLPVMVYIHGGRFARGSADSSTFSPEYLLDEDIVLVVPSYRFGPLGFLSTGDEVASGNWGLKDMALALKWVQSHVKYFGGDPDQVTIVGESSGSASVHLLTLSDTTIGHFVSNFDGRTCEIYVLKYSFQRDTKDPKDVIIRKNVDSTIFFGTGLFHRYITQSGSALGKWAHTPSAGYAKRAYDLGSYVGCSHDTSDALIDCLRTVDVSDILATYPKFLVWESQPGMVWTPTDEPDMAGAFLTDSPTNLFTAGKVRDLPWIVGVVRDEGLINTAVGRRSWVKAIKSYYFNDDLTTDRSLLLANLTILVSDALFFYPAHNGIRQQNALAKNPQYFYTFNYRGTYSASAIYGGSTTDYGVSHVDDLIYLYPSESLLGNFGGALSKTDWEMVDTMVQLWTSFVIDGVPKSSVFDAEMTWKAYNPTQDNYLRIGNGSDVALEVQYSFFKERMQFWDSLWNQTPL